MLDYTVINMNLNHLYQTKIIKSLRVLQSAVIYTLIWEIYDAWAIPKEVKMGVPNSTRNGIGHTLTSKSPFFMFKHHFMCETHCMMNIMFINEHDFIKLKNMMPCEHANFLNWLNAVILTSILHQCSIDAYYGFRPF